jgi:hypothetical protein
MRKTLFAFAILASALSITPIAHADAIDDFVLTGNGETVTFSLPATGVYTLHEHFDNFQASGPGTIDGAPATVEAVFYVKYFEFVQGAPDLNIYSNQLSNFPNLYGSIPYSWFVVPAEFPNPVDEGTFNVTFVPGTYQLQTGSTFFDHPFNPPLPYTLSITPETPIAPTPEPSSLILLATGAVGAITTLKRRKYMAPKVG